MVADFWNFYLKLLTNCICSIYEAHYYAYIVLSLFFIVLKLYVELLVMYQLMSTISIIE